MKGRQKFLYTARHGGFVKIGASINPWKRLPALTSLTASLAMPESVVGKSCRLVKVVRGSHSDERHLHARLRPYRICGEWFTASCLRDSAYSDVFSKRENVTEPPAGTMVPLYALVEYELLKRVRQEAKRRWHSLPRFVADALELALRAALQNGKRNK